jgi:hypothetical protein
VEKTLDNYVVSATKVIDYLIEDGGCDTCSKCAYYQTVNDGEDIEACKEFKKDGNIACRNGMIEYFENETN